MIKCFDIETNECLSTFSKNATSLAFISDNIFVSSAYGSTNALVWNMDNSIEPIHTINLDHEDNYVGGHPLMGVSSTIFLIGDGSLVKAFEFTNTNVWTKKSTFKGHSDTVSSLAKVNDSLFVSTSWDLSAKLWDITNDTECLFTFCGHTNILLSSVFLKEEKSIATGDYSGSIAVWSIAKYLENDQAKDEVQVIASSTQGHNTSDKDYGDQNPNTVEP